MTVDIFIHQISYSFKIDFITCYKLKPENKYETS